MNTVRIGVLDYGASNMGSVSYAFDRLEAISATVKSGEEIASCDALVIPGVGSFKAAMLKLEQLRKPIEEFASSGKPIFGICLGMQVLFDEGSEGGSCKGLGLLRGRVEKMSFAPKLPHVGWNQVKVMKSSKLFEGIAKDAYFYFVHSYACKPSSKAEVLGVTEFGASFVSAVEKKNVFGVQFHPEKSGNAGALLLQNFLKMV